MIEPAASHLDPIRQNTTIVLVRARNPANIGAAARAMHDFGFSSLRVVNEFPVPFQAARSAVDASAVLASATSHTTLAEAIADCTLVFGTTAVGERELRHELLQLPQAATHIRSQLASSNASARIALLFGSEKTGLSNDELSFCHALVTIPMAQHSGIRHPSMNLGQAVAVCLWELVRDSAEGSAASSMPRNPGSPASSLSGVATEMGDADSATLERLHGALTEVLEATEYTRRHAANCDPAHVRRLLRRVGIDPIDAPVWMGIFRQILWKLGRERR